MGMFSCICFSAIEPVLRLSLVVEDHTRKCSGDFTALGHYLYTSAWDMIATFLGICSDLCISYARILADFYDSYQMIYKWCFGHNSTSWPVLSYQKLSRGVACKGVYPVK